MKPSARVLRRLFLYDPISGQLFWKKRPVWMFKNGRNPRKSSAQAWNTRYANRAAFTSANSAGYLHGTLFRRDVQAHRIAYTIYHGEWPNHVDHINGVRSDNRIQNLRSVTQAQNVRNQALSKRNTSGYPGVYFNRKTGRYRARISTRYIGTYDTFEEAVEARRKSEIADGYHSNHGRARNA